MTHLVCASSSAMSTRAAFHGLRLQFLEDHKDAYATAAVESRENDFILDFQRRYFKRFPVSLAHDIEPSQEWLDAVDDNAPDTDISEPSAGGKTEDEYKKALHEYQEQCKLVIYRKEVSPYLEHHMSVSFYCHFSKFVDGSNTATIKLTDFRKTRMPRSTHFHSFSPNSFVPTSRSPISQRLSTCGPRTV